MKTVVKMLVVGVLLIMALAANAELLLYVDFNTADGTEPYGTDDFGNPGWDRDGASHWTRIYNTALRSSATNPRAAPHALPNGDPFPNDYTLVVKISSSYWHVNTGLHWGLMARYSKNVSGFSSYYYAYMHQQTFKLSRVVDGVSTNLATVADFRSENPDVTSYVAGDFWTYSLTVDGDQITATLTDAEGDLATTIQVTDNAILSGSPGVKHYSSQITYWDDFTVTVVPKGTLVIIN